MSEGATKKLSYLPQRQAVDIEFQDLTFSVPQGRKGSKLILRSVSGRFRPGQLSAILGPSGAGKSTLLNILAGYKCNGASGNIMINGEPRNMKKFRHLSRYIMQEDLLQPLLTVQEVMVVAADLKLGKCVTRDIKLKAIDEILDMLRLTETKNTQTDRLSGGEKKRVSIALELINNPPVIFLDEPTTGLDDLSSSQCISLLKSLADGGRTVICSIHSPSARLFALFNHVYIVAVGQCVYSGEVSDIVPFLASTISLHCPKHYNPADFIIEVSSGEYGDFTERLVSAVENGRINASKEPVEINEKSPLIETSACQLAAITYAPTTEEEEPEHAASLWLQFQILLRRMALQTVRNYKYIFLKIFFYVFLGLVIGSLFLNMGNDGSKTLFNFGLCFASMIALLYCAMCPVLMQFPYEVHLIKRECFNQWYAVGPYYWAMSICSLPMQVLLVTLMSGLTYVISDQPMELSRALMYLSVCIMLSIISESLGYLISSTVGVLNGIFIGPVSAVPMMLLAVYGWGSGAQNVPMLLRIVMKVSFLRFGLEGLTQAIYGNGRPNLPCPESEDFCVYANPQYLLEDMGLDQVAFWIDMLVLIGFYLAFRLGSYYLLKQRLSPNRTFIALHLIGRLVKSHFGMAH